MRSTPLSNMAVIIFVPPWSNGQKHLPDGFLFDYIRKIVPCLSALIHWVRGLPDHLLSECRDLYERSIAGTGFHVNMRLENLYYTVAWLNCQKKGSNCHKLPFFASIALQKDFLAR